MRSVLWCFLVTLGLSCADLSGKLPNPRDPEYHISQRNDNEIPLVEDEIEQKVGPKDVREAIKDAMVIIEPRFAEIEERSVGRRATKSSPKSRAIEKEREIFQETVRQISLRHNIPLEAAHNVTRRQISFPQQPGGFPEGQGSFQVFQNCAPPPISCNPSSPFRTIDGTCNNLRNPFWGSSSTPFQRLSPPAYDDGASVPRGGTNLQNPRLPNPRVLSRQLHFDFNDPDTRYTNMVMQFGQFLDHDLTLTPEADLRCCSNPGNSSCFPLLLPNNDAFYSRLQPPQFCLDFTRSTPFCFQNIREQFNANTGFIDASQVYGSTSDMSRQLRSGFNGFLKTNSQNPNFLPTSFDINGQQSAQGLFVGGDPRVNETPGLTALHTIFLREHNRIANQLRVSSPFILNDEQLFQLARKIVIAEMQHIVFNEYLPAILGPNTMSAYQLTTTGTSAYNNQVDPSIINSFATAAYRFGHTLINGLVKLFNNGVDSGSYRIRDAFLNPSQVNQNGGLGVQMLIEGLIRQNVQKYDNFVTDDVSNFLFKPANQNFGSDLPARNIHRGRDHGLPGYNAFRFACGMAPATAQTPPEIQPEAWNTISQLYSSVDDIDLFTAGLSEKPVAGGLSGPTFNCIKAIQFNRLKFGDRYFYTHVNQAGSFNAAQLAQIRRRTLSDVICQNTGIAQTQRNVFLSPSSTNPTVACAGRAPMDVTVFLQ